jgi:hypothetical protein
MLAVDVPSFSRSLRNRPRVLLSHRCSRSSPRGIFLDMPHDSSESALPSRARTCPTLSAAATALALRPGPYLSHCALESLRFSRSGSYASARARMAALSAAIPLSGTAVNTVTDGLFDDLLGTVVSFIPDGASRVWFAL